MIAILFCLLSRSAGQYGKDEDTQDFQLALICIYNFKQRILLQNFIKKNIKTGCHSLYDKINNY